MELTFKNGSANLASYGQPGPERPGRIWIEVMRDAIDFSAKPPALRPTPRFYFTIYRTGEGEIGRFSYRPRRDPDGGYPATQLVARKAQAVLKT